MTRAGASRTRRRRAPTVRRAVYDSYWRLAAERQLIFHRRAAGLPPPWTEDKVLSTKKFCNTYRASDRVSQYLIRRVIYGDRAYSPDDVFLRIVLFRLFSKQSTWELLEQETGGVCRATLDVDRLGDVLARRRESAPIYTAAFILATPAYGHAAKHRNHLVLVDEMFQPGKLAADLGGAASLQGVFDALLGWSGLGGFMAYQIAVDLNYSAELVFSEDSFTVAGPGALRGLHKIFTDFGDFTPSELIMRMVDRQDEEFERLGLDWRDLFGRRLNAIDAQGLCCETDKYAREMFPELISERSRIKQPFAPSTTRPRLPLFYPPKWGLNDRVVEQLGAQGDWPGENEPDGALPPMDQLDLFGDVAARGPAPAVGAR